MRQARRLNTNMRYLHETALEVAERLIATTGGALDTVMFVNSGSEANDIARRIARAVRTPAALPVRIRGAGRQPAALPQASRRHNSRACPASGRTATRSLRRQMPVSHGPSRPLYYCGTRTGICQRI